MKETNHTQETRAFRMHPDMLFSIIKSQAGTFDKAILELMMNAVDAGATEARFDFDGKTFAMQDDGKGFRDRQEIEAFFETFGTLHAAGDAVFGRFRMGRGQVMAFTRNRWRSGSFSMHVDIREKGLEYDLQTLPETVAGCRIEGDLYDPMSPSDTLRTIDGLTDMCKYLPIPAFINGKRVSLSMDSVKWTFEDDDAYYLLRPQSNSLEAYNLGVLVRSYYGAQAMGVGGLVVSKKPLQVNFARNDILVSSCEVWKRISAKLKVHSAETQEKAPVQNEAYRAMMLDRLIAGAFDSADEMVAAVMDAKVVTDYSNRHFSFDALATRLGGHRPLVLAQSHSLQADRVHQKDLAIVLSPKFANRARFKSLDEVIERIDANLGMFGIAEDWSIRKRLREIAERILPLESVAESINEQHDIIEEKRLSKDERVTLSVINYMSERIALSGGLGCQAIRKIRACTSETVDGFTDGKAVIYVERKYLKVPGYEGAIFSHFEAVKHLLVHEYLHEENDSTGHGHPAEFYERFHDLVSFKLHRVGLNAVKAYIAARQKAGMKLRRAELVALDLVAIRQEAEPAGADPEIEQAAALGFASVKAMHEHQVWLQQHGSQEYQQWARDAQIMHG